ncbi:MAG: hypothetical protein A3H93_15965 [Rhodocyclales bacterium RIFCSPLOWO2_02_FULL_63_24]|nr:MAG: hypothetical protein A3H93_15965 [Rhodocyclales bacterium RIFCSPLOWO2_02_FULL_63_24]
MSLTVLVVKSRRWRHGGWVVLTLAALAGSHRPVLAGASDMHLRWGEASYGYRYNPTHEPAWMGEGKALALIARAADGWEACGVRFRYEGITDKPPGAMDRVNVIGWRQDGAKHSAWTHWRARRSTGATMEADITLYANVFDEYRKRGLNIELELYKSIVHELGHVLGLAHSDRAGDSMSVRVRTRPEWRLPSDNDLARCRNNYRVAAAEL